MLVGETGKTGILREKTGFSGGKPEYPWKRKQNIAWKKHRNFDKQFELLKVAHFPSNWCAAEKKNSGYSLGCVSLHI